jgi:hypothetical protein
MQTKTFPTDTIPIKIECDYDVFVYHYKNGRESESSILFLLKVFEETFSYWSQIIKSKNLYEDFTMYSVFKFLDKDNKPIGTVENKLKVYLSYNKRSDIKVYDDIVLCFLEIYHNKVGIDKESYYLNPRKLIYHIAMEMKYAIFLHIRKINQLCKRDLHFHKNSLYFTSRQTSYEENMDLILIFNQIDSINNWTKYLFFLIKEGYTIKQRCELLNLTPKELAQEENIIWQLLRQKQLNNLNPQDLV